MPGDKKGKKDFKCCHCGKLVSDSKLLGTKHRNHCPFCLWSKHVDLKEAGDRGSLCKNPMKPVGLTFKQEGKDKYGKLRQGELMLLHQCSGCVKISLNRIAGDDTAAAILKLLNTSEKLKKQPLAGIRTLTAKDKKEVQKQLFGRNFE